MWDWWENFILQFDAATRDIFSNATSMERTSSLFGCRFEWETAKKMQFSSVIAVALPKHHNKYSDSMHWASSEWTSRRPLYVTSTSYIDEFPIQWRYSFSACVCFTNIPRSQSWYTYNIAKAGTTEKGDGRCDRNRGVHTKTWTEFLVQHFWPEHRKEQKKKTITTLSSHPHCPMSSNVYLKNSTWCQPKYRE